MTLDKELVVPAAITTHPDERNSVARPTNLHVPHDYEHFRNTCEHAMVGLGRFELPISRPPAERSRPN